MPMGKPFVNSETYNAKWHSRAVLVCVAIVAWPSSYKHTNERRLLFPFLSQTSHIFKKKKKVQMNKSKWSLKDSYHIRENNGGIHLALPRSCLWGQAQLCPLCSASLPTLETTVFPKSQVFPWQFPWQCWNGSGIERTGGRGGGRAKRRNERDPENAEGGGRAAFSVSWKLVCQVLVSRGLYVYPTTLNYSF